MNNKRNPFLQVRESLEHISFGFIAQMSGKCAILYEGAINADIKSKII